MGILTIVILLTISVLVHEWGHYIVLRRNGLKVDAFAIGLGPIIWKRMMKSGTEFRICAIPLGGYVKGPKKGEEGSLDDAKPWVRFKVVMAGMFMNATLAFVAFLVVFYALGGIPVKVAPYVAWIPHWLRIPAVAFALSYGLWLATPPLIVYIIVVKGIGGLMAGAIGPIGIFMLGHSQGTAVTTSWAVYFTHLALWSGMMLGVLNSGLAGANLLPIFPLDGGHALEAILEMIIGRRRLAYFQKVFHPLSIILFVALVIVIFYGDINRLITGRPLGS